MNWKALGMVVFVWVCIIGFVFGVAVNPGMTFKVMIGSLAVVAVVGLTWSMYDSFCDLFE